LHDASIARLGDVLGRLYESQNCSAARALELVGERWSLLILRNAAFAGHTRFSEFERRLGIAPNVLASRLEGFVAAGLMEVHPNAAHKGQNEYLLTEMGRDFVPALVALTSWGDRWAAPDGPPMVYQHEACGGDIELELRCGACQELAAPAAVMARPGPGFRVADADGPGARKTPGQGSADLSRAR
jgi:DNA-binding HxlR family transcriptional regulator